MKTLSATLHLPFNYGNALQMLALHKYLFKIGISADVLARWYEPDRNEISAYHNMLKTRFGWLRFLWHLLNFSGAWAILRRETKIVEWLRLNIRWSSLKGHDVDVSRLDYDVVIVGSDQVWNPAHATSDFFLFGDFPDVVRKISYAASMGTDVFPPERIAFYKQALRRFDAISVRESSARKIIEEQLGSDATLVCDPTLLHSREDWCDILDFDLPKKVNDDIVMYLVTPNWRERWRDVLRIARTTGRKVHFYAYAYTPAEVVSLRTPWQLPIRAVANLIKRVCLYCSGVRLHLSATPTEFVRRIAASNGLITDSFHGLMFATIFGKSCNVTVGEHAERKQMSARLRNFLADFGNPEIMTAKPDPAAMRVVGITPRLRELIDFSKKWLEEVIS